MAIHSFLFVERVRRRNRLKLSEWAKLNGINYKTAWTWFRKGLMPIEAKQMPSGMIIVYPDKPIQDAKGV